MLPVPGDPGPLGLSLFTSEVIKHLPRQPVVREGALRDTTVRTLQYKAQTAQVGGGKIGGPWWAQDGGQELLERVAGTERAGGSGGRTPMGACRPGDQEVGGSGFHS